MATAAVLQQTRRSPERSSAEDSSSGGWTGRYRRVALLALWAVAVGYLAVSIDRQWVADDEGLLGQTAERVLQGEAPHRHFGDMYTGGQAYFHALAFKIGGVSLLVLRYTLLLAAAAWCERVLSFSAAPAGVAA